MARGNKNKFTIEQVLEAIKGSSGIKATIAQRLGCNRNTVDNYLTRYATVREAYQDEAEVTDDLAESVIINNIKYALKAQRDTSLPVDASDAKWWVERRRRDKFSTRVEQEHSGLIGIKGYATVSPDDWDKTQPPTDSDI